MSASNRVMRRFANVLTVILAIAALAVAAYTFLGQRRLIERLEAAERTLGEHREWNSARDQERLEDNRWFHLLLRAQESPWIGSENSPVQCRLTVESDVYRPSEPVRILAEVRNASDQVQTVGGMLFEPFTLKLTHEGQEAKYVGPQKSMAPPMPVTLPPGRIVKRAITLDRGQFSELASPGLFAIEWTYRSEAYPPKVTWAGNLPAVRVEWRAQ